MEKKGGRNTRKQCHYCGIELDYLLPFKCKHCREEYCKDHYLPENHNCPNFSPSRTLIKNSYKPVTYSKETYTSRPVQNSFSGYNYKPSEKKYHKDNNRFNSFKYETKRLTMKMLKNKWFWIIGLPIILVIILYVFVWLVYGQLWANVTLFMVVFFIAIILMIIFNPPKKRSALEQAEIEKGYLQEIGRQRAQDERRRRW